MEVIAEDAESDGNSYQKEEDDYILGLHEFIL